MAQATLVFLEAALLLEGLFLTASSTATGGLSMLASDILRCSRSNVTLVPRCGESASLRFGYFKFGNREIKNTHHVHRPSLSKNIRNTSKHTHTLTSHPCSLSSSNTVLLLLPSSFAFLFNSFTSSALPSVSSRTQLLRSAPRAWPSYL